MEGHRDWSAPAERRKVVDYGDGMAWFVVRTNPRCEDRAMVTLAEKGFDAFAPKGTKRMVHHRSKRTIERPFPLLVGYVFIAMPAAPERRHWGLVRECHGVHSVLGVNGAPLAVPAPEVEVLRQAEAEGRLRFEAEGRRREAHSFRDGDTVRIGLGPFSGFMGQVTDASCMRAIRLLIRLFGRMTDITVPVDGLEMV